MVDVYVARSMQPGDHVVNELGIFSTLELAQTACGESPNRWEQDNDGVWTREAQWSPEVEWVDKWGQRHRNRGLVNGQAWVVRQTLDVQTDSPAEWTAVPPWGELVT